MVVSLDILQLETLFILTQVLHLREPQLDSGMLLLLLTVVMWDISGSLGHTLTEWLVSLTLWQAW